MSAAGPVRPRPVAGPARPRRAARSTRRLAAALAAVALVPLSGCAAGIQAETSRQRPTIDGIGSAIGTLTVRNTYVGGPVEPGGSAPLLTSIFNGGNEPDRLVSVTSPESGPATLPAETTIPPGGQQLFYSPERVLRLPAVTVPMRPGEIVPIVLTFERAGELRMSVPVSPVAPEVLAEPAGGGEGAPPPAPSASPSGPAAPAPEGSAAPSPSASPAAPGSPTPAAPSPSATIAP